MQKLLSQLLPSCEYNFVAADGITPIDQKEISNIPISNLVFDSREVTKDSLFFALPGIHANGNNYIPQAIEKGANAIVFQDELDHELQLKIAKAITKRQIEATVYEGNVNYFPVLIKVKDSRFAMAPISDYFYDSPSKKLVIIGVTGTEGKSSTVSFIWQLLRLCGKKAGFISTVEYSFGDEAIANPQHQTTPEAPIIQHHLNKMLENGCQYAVIESSSHGLSPKTNRLGNVLFDCGVFMNVTLEHLEFHKTFEQYKKDKANLFRLLDCHDHIKEIAGEKLTIPSFGVVNLEDPSAQYFIDSTKKQVYGFTTQGKAGKAATNKEVDLPEIPENINYFEGLNICAEKEGISFDVNIHENTDKNEILQLTANLPGAFNAYNIMASIIAVSKLTNLSYQEVASKVKDVAPIKGRMTVIEQNQPFEVIIDYAHTPSSFETIFPPIRKRCKGKMIALFGSGGERDLTKRPLQGKIAASYCDTVILTDEDPRGEDSVELLKMIAVGSQEQGKKLDEDLFIIPDRKKAIRYAFSIAKENDIILLLGKSHENSIIYKDYVMPYDEISEAQLALSELGYKL
ncbi:MAG: UDP-N-acetylmuramoyl-L-alanyl-D-glutamate--2,6-diaminopimelate ligase [Treponema sp.]|nr:UDP-N-acetylmuramoyl-L-alanyl-D-glutamate--2,6-diaminopimelate ligase [Treponema sp.]